MPIRSCGARRVSPDWPEEDRDVLHRWLSQDGHLDYLAQARFNRGTIRLVTRTCSRQFITRTRSQTHYGDLDQRRVHRAQPAGARKRRGDLGRGQVGRTQRPATGGAGDHIPSRGSRRRWDGGR